MEVQVLHPVRPMRTLAAIVLGGFLLPAATLEQLSIEDMSRKATVIVRGHVTGCGGETRGQLIFTRCRVQVSERWKGTAGAAVDFLVPGGTAAGYTQKFTGTPRFAPGEQYVLFLWTGRSGVTQVIGLSQGVFDIRPDAKGGVVARREASTERMLNAAGETVKDQAITLTVAALRQRVERALGGGSGR